MSKTLRIITFSGLFSMLCACAVSQMTDVATTEQLAQAEKSRTFSQSYEPTWKATIKTLSTSGIPIANQDKSSGTIVTEWIVEKEAIGIFQAGKRMKVNIFVEKAGGNTTQVTATINFQIRVTDESEWQPTARTSKQLNLEKEFFDEIQKTLL